MLQNNAVCKAPIVQGQLVEVGKKLNCLFQDLTAIAERAQKVKVRCFGDQLDECCGASPRPMPCGEVGTIHAVITDIDEVVSALRSSISHLEEL